MQQMVDRAHGPNDRLVFVTSSHGSGDGQGNSYLCLLPDPFEATTANERQGSYMDHELAADLSRNGSNHSRTFLFILLLRRLDRGAAHLAAQRGGNHHLHQEGVRLR